MEHRAVVRVVRQFRFRCRRHYPVCNFCLHKIGIPCHLFALMKPLYCPLAKSVLAAFGILLLGLASAFAARAATLPNIVIIFTDDQGYADVGVFGAKGFQTPNLDRLASQGCIFRNFHVAQPVCSASRAGLLTGCYPNRIGIHGALGPRSKVGISDGEMTLAQLVKQRGYVTGIFGKWHLGDSPQFLPLRHGFDEYFGLPYSNDMWPLRPDLVNLPPNDEKRKRGYPDLVMYEGNKIAIPQVTHEDQNQLTTWYTEHAVRFIERNKDHPFFLYLAHNMPHVPLHVSDKFRGKTERGLYGDVIEEIDWSVGQVMDALDRTGAAGNTWVIFTSDNGPWLSYGDHAGSAYPLREGKGTCWEGGTREPCIMRWPGKIPAGTESKEMFLSLDLFPTIANLIRPAPGEESAHRLLVLLRGQPTASHRYRRWPLETSTAPYLSHSGRQAGRPRRDARAL